MADKVSEKEVASTVEDVVDKAKVVEEEEEEETPVVEEEKTPSEENDAKQNGDEETEKNGERNGDDATDKCSRIKRKSAGGDAAAEENPSDAATPEKKAKLDDAESNGTTEVAA